MPIQRALHFPWPPKLPIDGGQGAPIPEVHDGELPNSGALTMAIRKLPKEEWKPYFERVSRLVIGKRAEIEVASLALGDQIEAEWLPLLGITYDPKDDSIEIALEGLDHLIDRPRDVHVDEEALGLSRLQIVTADGDQHLVQLREPLMLPPP